MQLFFQLLRPQSLLVYILILLVIERVIFMSVCLFQHLLHLASHSLNHFPTLYFAPDDIFAPFFPLLRGFFARRYGLLAAFEANFCGLKGFLSGF
jgi:hypothetical protein